MNKVLAMKRVQFFICDIRGMHIIKDNYVLYTEKKNFMCFA